MDTHTHTYSNAKNKTKQTNKKTLKAVPGKGG